MRFGTRTQKLRSAWAYSRMTPVEREAARALARHDTLRVTDYVYGRRSGVLYADNGFSLVHDVTNGRNIEADSIDEAAARANCYNL